VSIIGDCCRAAAWEQQETIPIDDSLTTIPVRHQLAGEAKQTMMFRVAVRVRVTSNNSWTGRAAESKWAQDHMCHKLFFVSIVLNISFLVQKFDAINHWHMFRNALAQSSFSSFANENCKLQNEVRMNVTFERGSARDPRRSPLSAELNDASTWRIGVPVAQFVVTLLCNDSSC